MNFDKLFIKPYFAVVCAALFAIGLMSTGADSAETLDLEKLLVISREANPLILAANARVRQQEGRLVKTRSDQMPQIYGSFGYEKLNRKPYAYAFDNDEKNQTGVVPMGYEETYRAALNLTQVLYSGGTLPARTEAEKLLVTARKTELDRTVQQVGNGTRRAFYELQKSISGAQVADEALNLAKEHLRQVEIFYRTGAVAKNEVLRVQVSVSSSKLDLIRAESNVKVAWKELERITGQSLEENYTVAAGDYDLENFDVPEDPLARALGLRPELKGLEASRNAALQTVRAVKGQVMPQVSLSAQASVADDKIFPSEDDEWRIGIFAELRLFDSGKVHGQVVEAQGVAEELLYRIEDLKRDIGLGVSKASVNLDSAIQRVKVTEDSVVQSEEDYRIAMKRYQNQMGTNIDVLDARLAMTDTRNARTNAVAEARTAYADLLYAMGEL
ncbi:MAG: TolC family protein [Synergistaceae bacterium]|nr:TolC family protein [Synergistaceae bacterium]